MKKICISFIILLLIFSTQVLALEDWADKNKKIYDAVELALSEYMEPYRSEDVPENERVLNYDYRGTLFDYSKESEGIFKVSINFDVEPYSKENTIWRLEDNYIFVEYSIVDGEYIVKNISETPENYDKFLERFEEYKKNGYVTTETQAVQGDKNEVLNFSNEIEKMSNTIFIISAIVLLIVVVAVIVKIVRKRK